MTRPLLAVRVEGRTGAPLVFLHALGGSSRYWAGRLGPLPTGHRCVMPDLLGFGRSPRPDIAYTITDHLTALTDTLAALGMADEPLTLIGHSLGATLAVEFAARFPERVGGLVVLGLPLYANAAQARAYVRAHGEWMARVTVANGRTAHLVHLVVATFRPLIASLARRAAGDFPPEVAADTVQHSWASYSGTLQHCVLDHDVTPALHLLPAMPILALHGTHDPSAPLPPIRAFASGCPNFHLDVLEGGHHLFLTQHQACLRAIADYLALVASH